MREFSRIIFRALGWSIGAFTTLLALEGIRQFTDQMSSIGWKGAEDLAFVVAMLITVVPGYVLTYALLKTTRRNT